jgi:hypothetical protein
MPFLIACGGMMENEHNKLYPEDQAKVDAYLKQGYNNVERKPYRPLKLLGILLIMVSTISAGALLLAWMSGIH